MNSNRDYAFGKYGVECVQPKFRFDMMGPQVVLKRLEYLAANPDVLQRERHRFSISPPLPRPSPTFSTLSTDPNAPPPRSLKPGQRDRFIVNLEWGQSHVSNQYRSEKRIAAMRMLSRKPEDGPYLLGVESEKRVKAKVKADWIAQGIWGDDWDDETGHLDWKVWKHEQPLPDDEDEDDGASGRQPHRPSSGLASTQPPPSPPKPRTTVDEKAREAARRDRDASRPFQRFIYLVSEERERILAAADATGPDSTLPEATGPTTAPLDINTQAYTNVKANWVERGLWYRKWGQLPGMNWKHELPHDRDELWMEGYTPPPRPPRIRTRPFRFTSPDPDSPESTQEVADPSPPGGNSPPIIPSEVSRQSSHSAPAEVYPSVEAPDGVSVPIAKSPTSSAPSADPEQGPGRAGGRRSPRRSTNIDSVVSGSISKAKKGQSPVGRQTRSPKAKVLAAELEQAKPRRSARLQAQESTPPQPQPTLYGGNAKSGGKSQKRDKQQGIARGKGRKL
ncbi:hypothetical protein EDB80DRAFT_203497 [Ilyonectria destructans]|nr:hypothetical protein EDB80DRAFT_203497 [Ilyonectria destructans]